MNGRIKSFSKKCKHSDNILLRLLYQSSLGLLLFFRFLTRAKYRSELFYGFWYAKNYHQRSSFTQLNRYPDLCSISRDFLSDRTVSNILSFGCSTGEEVESLSQYFPDAKISGTDINKRSVKLARARYGNDRKNFFHSLSPQFEQANGFDLIFCCAVFQSTDNRTSINNEVSAYPFGQFQSSLDMLDQKLSKGGLIVIDHCDFRFIDTSLYRRYKALPVEGNQKRRNRPCYDKHNQKISDFSENDRVFVKITN